jgi:dihydropteroate synthase
LTPDSFSDGGQFVDPDAALAQARRMVTEGADILDIGAESTRPYGGATPVPRDEELARLAPVVPEAVSLGVPVSIDTIKAEVAAWALDRGAAIVNDVWGLQRDPEMAPLVARRGVPVIVMHNRNSADPALDIMADIAAFFERSLAIARRAGIARDRIVLDPGIGFGKTPEQSMTAIRHLARLKAFGLPLLIGASRKRFIAAVTPSQPQQRLGGSIAAHLLAVQNGAAIIRTHDVAETVQAMRVAAALGRGVMADTIFITGLSLHAFHGVMEHERKVGQTFAIDLALRIDLAGASRSDKLADTVSYDRVVDVAASAFCGERFRLVEAAAGAVAEAVLASFPQVSGLRVTVHKPHAPIAATFADVGISIERSRG